MIKVTILLTSNQIQTVQSNKNLHKNLQNTTNKSEIILTVIC